MLRSVAEGLGLLSDQVEQFRVQVQKLPQSPEARQLTEQWQRLRDETLKAGSVTEDSVKKELMPRLQREMEGLEQRLRDLQAKSAGQPPSR